MFRHNSVHRFYSVSDMKISGEGERESNEHVKIIQSSNKTPIGWGERGFSGNKKKTSGCFRNIDLCGSGRRKTISSDKGPGFRRQIHDNTDDRRVGRSGCCGGGGDRTAAAALLLD